MANKTMDKAKYIIGIDSGATSSEALVLQTPLAKTLPPLKGRLGGLIKKYPPINFNVLGFDESLKRLVHIIKDSSKKIGMNNIAYIAAGISGARSEKDRTQLAKSVSKGTGFNKIKILPDTEIAFYSVFGHNQTNCGVLIAGTGSVLIFRGPGLRFMRRGGWGRILGDEGSGWWIGREALSAAAKRYDTVGKNSFLLKMLDSKFSLNEDNIIEKIYHKNFDISKIAKEVFRLAEKGDRISGEIIRSAAQQLAEMLNVVGKTEHTIALCGSLFTEEKLLEKYLRKIVKEEFPYINLIKPKRKPVWGAVEIAKSLLN
jgi:N-acetylglucosamine kinase-like BadF-type ATPase